MSEALYSLTLLADMPLDNINIVAGLCKKHKRRILLLAPFSSDIAMTVMHISYALGMLDIHDRAYLAVIDKLLHRAEELVVSEHVANKHVYALSLCGLFYRQTLLLRWRSGLFEQNIVANLYCLHSGIEVLAVHCRYDRGISDLAKSK